MALSGKVPMRGRVVSAGDTPASTKFVTGRFDYHDDAARDRKLDGCGGPRVPRGRGWADAEVASAE